MWKSPGMRKKLETKLVNRWSTENPTVVELGQTREVVTSMFCNDQHVFCAALWGIVGVYQLDGQWVRDLTPTERGPMYVNLAGGEGVLAAWSDFGVWSVWGIKGLEEELDTGFTGFNFDDDDDPDAHSLISTVQVIDQSKIALLVVHDMEDHNKVSLVFLKRGEQVWEEKIVACFPSFACWLASDGHWVALTNQATANNDVTKVTLWKEENTGQDIDLPGCSGSVVRSNVMMELPFLALILIDRVNMTTSVKVYRMAEDKQMKDLNSAASLVKSISFSNCRPMITTLSNRHFLGFVQAEAEVGVEGRLLHFVEKSNLFSDSSAIGRIQIHMPATSLSHQVALNTTTLVFHRREGDDQGLHSVLAKKDFWMTNNILPEL